MGARLAIHFREVARWVAIVALPCLLAGCAGYQLGQAKPSYLKDIHTLAVPTFRNDTLEARIEALATGTVVKQIEQDGTYTVASPDTADAILNATVDSVSRTPVRSATANVLLTTEFTLTVTVHFQLVQRGTGRVLESGAVDGQTSFFVSGDVQQDQRQALPLALERLAVRLTSRLSEGF